ncbi:MAG: ExbD/TolR family protein [Acidobacteria bacterium]|nr:ExbD/TolR family protein [Acidobacteriota bacterium]
MPKLQESSSSSRRGRRGPRVSTSLAEINVVPLVDVMLVLLIIFMVTAPMMQQGYGVTLPESRRSQPTDTTPIAVSIPADFARTGTVRFGDEEVRLSLLAERVRQAMESRTEKNVYLRGDGGVTLQELTRVFDALKEGGVVNVGIATQPGR